MGAQKFTCVHGCFYEEAAQTIHPEVHSERGRGPHGPDSPTLPYLPQTGIMAVYLIDYYNSHVYLGVNAVVKMLRQRRFISPPMRDVLPVTINPAM